MDVVFVSFFVRSFCGRSFCDFRSQRISNLNPLASLFQDFSGIAGNAKPMLSCRPNCLFHDSQELDLKIFGDLLEVFFGRGLDHGVLGFLVEFEVQSGSSDFLITFSFICLGLSFWRILEV